MANEWKLYTRVGEIEARPWTEAEARHYHRFAIAPYSEGVSPCVNRADDATAAAVPPVGYVARNPDNHADQWYIAPDYFAKHYAELTRRDAEAREGCDIAAAVRGVLSQIDLNDIQRFDAEYVDPLPERLNHHVNGPAVRQRREALRALIAIEAIVDPPPVPNVTGEK